MKNNLASLLLLFAMFTVLPGCTLIGDIFKAGVWVGILVVVAVIALIFFLVGKMGKKG